MTVAALMDALPQLDWMTDPALVRQKYWPPVGRVDNVHGDRNLFCSCVPVSAWAE